MDEDLHDKLLNKIPLFDLTGYVKGKDLGSGSFGITFVATKDNHQVVIKQFFNKPGLNLEREIINLYKCNQHNLVVPFLGISFQDFTGSELDIPLLVFEFEQSGSLQSFLRNNQVDDIEKQIIIYGIAKGIQSIHNKGIAHRDLKPDNILLNDSHYPLICDLGCSKQISQAQILQATPLIGTPLYLSPEMLLGTDLTSDALFPSDIFSFGLILYNLITNKIPYLDEIKPLDIISLMNFLKSDKRIQLPDSIPSWFRYLIQLCWKQDPKERPTINDIVALFEAGIALPLVYSSSEDHKYFDYLNEFLDLGLQPIGSETLSTWHSELLRCNKTDLALVVELALADYFRDPRIQTQLGYKYFNGIRVNRDYTKAVAYFKEAADHGNCESRFYLFEIYKFGLNNIEPNIQHSNHYLELAINGNYQLAIDQRNQDSAFSSVSKDNVPAILILGEERTGKTSFINRLFNTDRKNPLLFPTTHIRNYYYPFTNPTTQEKSYILIQDTPPIDSLNKNELSPNIKIVVFIYDKSNQTTFDSFDNYLHFISANIHNKFDLFVLGNKMDLIGIFNGQAGAKSNQNGFKYFELSTLTLTYLQPVIDEIFDCLLQTNNPSPPKVTTYIVPNSTNVQPLTFIILGLSGVGKTCFSIRLLENTFDGSVMPTFSPTLVSFNLGINSISIFDTPGDKALRSSLVSFIRTCQIFGLMFDLNSSSSFNEIDDFYKLIDDHVQPPYEILLIGNKSDLERNVSYEEASEKARSFKAQYIEISSKEARNFDEVRNIINQMCNTINAQLYPNPKTVQLNETNGKSKHEKCKC